MNTTLVLARLRLFSCIAGTLGLAGLLYHLDSPFGPIFRLSVYGFFAGLFGLLATSGLIAYRQTASWRKIAGTCALVLALAVLLVFVAWQADYRIFLRKDIPANLTTAAWLADLDYLQQQLISRHPGLFSLVSKQEFEDTIGHVRQEMASLNEAQRGVEFMRITALLNDGHTSLLPVPGLDWQFLPLKTYWFDDGLYVVDASKEYRDTIGSRITHIGKVGIAEVFERFKSIIGAENELHKKFRFQIWMLVPEILHALAIIETTDNVPMTLVSGSEKPYQINFSPEPAYAWFYWYLHRPVDRQASPAIPNPRKRNYFLAYRPDSGTAYLQINAIAPQSPHASFRDLVGQIEQLTASEQVEKLIIDLRNCPGGNAVLAEPLVQFLSDYPGFRKRGRLFALIGRKTYSAAVNFVTMLENRTSTIFAGEPTGEGPNQFGDHLKVTLPNSRIDLLVSSRYWQFSPALDRRSWIEPDIRVDYCFEHFRRQEDPVVDAVLQYTSVSAPGAIALEEPGEWQGEYALNGLQGLRIVAGNDGPVLTIFNSRNEAPLVRTIIFRRSPDTLCTNIRNVFLTTTGPGRSLKLNWKGAEAVLERVAKNDRLPLDLLRHGDVPLAWRQLLHSRDRGEPLPSNIELSINNAGYHSLRSGDTETAIVVFRLNVDLFPHSANVYDSLGEAYLAAHDVTSARKYYGRAAALDPGNSHAAAVVKQLAGTK